MVELEVRRRNDPAVWWHRPVLWFTRKTAGRFALCIPTPEKWHGTVYTDFELTDRTYVHEAVHVRQAMRHGWWSFVVCYLLSSVCRMRMEAEAYASEEGRDVHVTIARYSNVYRWDYDEEVVNEGIEIYRVFGSPRFTITSNRLGV